MPSVCKLQNNNLPVGRLAQTMCANNTLDVVELVYD
jgi:hypothetical protein